MSSSSASDNEENEACQALARILAKTGASQIEHSNDSESDSDSSSCGVDFQDWFKKIQETFSANDVDNHHDKHQHIINQRINNNHDDNDQHDDLAIILHGNDDSDEDASDNDGSYGCAVEETMAAISRRFDQYQNDALKEKSQCFQSEGNMTITDVTSFKDETAIPMNDINNSEQLPSLGYNDQASDAHDHPSVKIPRYSQFPKAAQNFVAALQKNRACQRFIRKKLIEIEAKIEENKKLKERVKCLMEFQLACKRKVGFLLGQKKDPRINLIAAQKSRSTKSEKRCMKFPSLYYGPVENCDVPKYKMLKRRFPLSYTTRKWSNIEKEKLARGIKQQYQEMVLLNSMNGDIEAEDSMNQDLLTSVLNYDFEVTPEELRPFLPSVKWERLASMYLPGRTGAECKSRWLNFDDPLINHSPWTMMEDKKLLVLVQERGIYDWLDISRALGSQRTPFQCLARYQRSLNPHILNKEWTPDEDAKLCEAVEIFGESRWQLVSSTLDGRTGPQCSNRWRKTLNPNRKKVGRWSVDEDKRLKVAVTLFGAKNWNKIARFAPGRTQVQCRERWFNCLDPALKFETWSKEEDTMLLEAIEKQGYSWSKVASCVPGRSDCQCLRRWKILLPHEVPMLRAARQMKQTVLISNFVDRESSRPVIGPSDLISFVNTSDPGSVDNMMAVQRQCSDKKTKKPRTKTRKSAQGNSTEVPGSSSNASEDGQTKKTRKRKSSKQQLEMQMRVTENDLLDNSMDAMIVTTNNDASTTIGTKQRIKKARKKNQQRYSKKTEHQLGTKANLNLPLNIIPACNPINSSEVNELSFLLGENDRCDGILDGFGRMKHKRVGILRKGFFEFSQGTVHDASFEQNFKLMRNDPPCKFRDNIMKIPAENTITTFDAEWKFKKGRTYSRRQKIQKQPNMSRAKSSQTLETMAACNPVDHLSLVPGENDNNEITGVSRQSVESSMEEGFRIRADEDVPLISWLNSLSRRKKNKVDYMTQPEQPAQALTICSHSTRSKRPIKIPARLLE